MKSIDSDWETMINSNDPVIRQKLARSLGQKDTDKKALRMLEILLRDEVSYVKTEALLSLAKVGNEKQLESVLNLLKDHDEMVRLDALETAFHLGACKALKYITNMLNDKKALVRSYAGYYLGKIGDKTSVYELEMSLQHEHSSLAKVGILQGLILLGKEERLLELLSLLKSKSYHVRSSIANGIELIPINSQYRNLVLESLKKALENERTIAVGSSIRNALLKFEKQSSAERPT